jgi:mRNA guanylyltransferase
MQIDRKENIYQNYYLTFPHQDGLEYNHSNTVLDAEYVIDVDPGTGQVSSSQRSLLVSLLKLFPLLFQHIPRLLVFDCLVLDSENLMEKPLLKRYGVSSIFFHIALSSTDRLTSLLVLVVFSD